MTAKEIYAKSRRENPHYPACHAWRTAKVEADREPIEWKESRNGNGYHATLKRGAFTVNIEAEPDDDLNGYEMRERGEYTDRWKPGAIDLEKAGDWGGRGHYRYWVPANPEYKHLDYRLVKAIGNGDALCFYVRAVVELEGVKLADCGMGSGLCLIGNRKETEATLAYLTELAHELIDEAMAEANQAIDRIIGASKKREADNLALFDPWTAYESK